MELSNNNNTINNDQWCPDVIVLGPGGPKGFLELGALLRLEESIDFKNIKNWTGCSIGSAIALLLVIGYSVKEIIKICWNTNILNDITDINIPKGENNFSIDEKKLEEKVIEKFGMVLTLNKLYMATGRKLTIVTYNFDDCRAEYFNTDTEPNISCVHAVMLSMSIPLINQAKKYKGKDYIDGAVVNPFPIDIHDDGTKIILGIYIINTKSDDKNLINRAYKMINAPINQIRERIIKHSSNKCHFLMLNASNIETKKDMISLGYDEASTFLDKISNPEKYTVLLPEDEEIPILKDEHIFDSLIGDVNLIPTKQDTDFNFLDISLTNENQYTESYVESLLWNKTKIEI